MAVGLIVSIYFFANSTAYTGPIAKNNPDLGDITFIVGFVITAVLYFVFNLGLRKQTTDARTAVGSRS
jgi:hypothetical protein